MVQFSAVVATILQILLQPLQLGCCKITVYKLEKWVGTLSKLQVVHSQLLRVKQTELQTNTKTDDL